MPAHKPIEKPEDLKGFKIRLPVVPYFIEPRCVSDADQFCRGVQRAADRVVDGQENALVLIEVFFLRKEPVFAKGCQAAPASHEDRY